MVDSLKTFNEGEYIYASETNSNNQYLLSKLSDNAAQVQTYVEGEISSIQSNVASVQATLQGNIDEAKTETNNLKTDIYTKGFLPNYSAGVSISTGYKATKNGWVYFEGKVNGGQKIGYVNGKRVFLSAQGVNYHQPIGAMVLVGKGDTVTTSGSFASIVFYPCKGGV